MVLRRRILRSKFPFLIGHALQVAIASTSTELPPLRGLAAIAGSLALTNGELVLTAINRSAILIRLVFSVLSLADRVRYAFAKSGADAASNGPFCGTRWNLSFQDASVCLALSQKKRAFGGSITVATFYVLSATFFGGSGAFGYRDVGDR